MSGFSNSIIGGATKLIRKAIQSPNFLTGVSGWTINEDGSAEFNNITVRGNIEDGTIFFYNGTPALGNLIGSIAPSSGHDMHGNTYNGPGEFIYDPSTGNTIASISSLTIIPRPGNVAFQNEGIASYDNSDFSSTLRGGQLIFGYDDGVTLTVNGFIDITVNTNPVVGPFIEISPPTKDINKSGTILDLYGAPASGTATPFALMYEGTIPGGVQNAVATNFFIFGQIGYAVVTYPGGTKTITPESWHGMALQTGWTVTSGQGTPAYKKLADSNYIACEGEARSVAAPASGAIIATGLPAPSTPKYRSCIDRNSGHTFMAIISTTGNLSINNWNGFVLAAGCEIELSFTYPLDI